MSVDLMKGYWQIVIKKEDRPKTSFQWRCKRYQFKRLPFGLKSAGSIFSKCVADALASESLDVDPNILIYLDDMAICAPDFEQFLDSHRKMFRALWKFNLKLKPQKSMFLKPQISFLGTTIDKTGQRPDPEYIAGV